MLTPDKFLHLLQTAGSVGSKLNSLRSFALGEQMSEMLSDWELQATREALRKAALARDPRSQIWTGIGHLETAHEVFRSIHGKRPRYTATWHTLTRRVTAAHRDINVLVLMSILYKCVGEDILCSATLEEAEDLALFCDDYVEREITTELKKGTLMFSVFLFDPRFYYWMYKLGKWDGFNRSYVIGARRALLEGATTQAKAAA